MKHLLYVKGDDNIPSGILDNNGDIVLDCCKVCGEFEAGLSNDCNDNLSFDQWHEEFGEEIAIMHAETGQNREMCFDEEKELMKLYEKYLDKL